MKFNFFGFRFSTPVEFNVSVSTRQDVTLSSSGEIINLLKMGNVGNLRLSFFEGQGFLKAQLIAGPKRKEGVCYWFSIMLTGDKKHSCITRYIKVMQEVQELAPELVVKKWRWRGLKSLVAGIKEIYREKRRISKYENCEPGNPGYSWLQNCRSLPKGLIRQYLSV